MRKSRFLAAITFALVFAVSSISDARAALPDDSAQPLIVNASWLAERISSPSLVVLQLGEKDVYDKGHIPGARYVNYDDISTPMDMKSGALMLELPPVEQLVALFEKLGVNDNSQIVVYFGKEWVTPTARLFLTLDYLGFRDHLSFLDGGMPAWIAEGRPINKDVPSVAPGVFTPHPRNDVIATADYVISKMHEPHFALVDGRDNNCYTGESKCGHPRGGHIPGAGNIPSPSALTDKNSKLKDRDALAALFRDAGVQPGDQVIAYCHIGQKASLIWLLARSLGYDARMYDGSYEEWSKRTDLPVMKGNSRSGQ
ncbi:MAG: sulfurtransferase [Candidatus Acidiferrales bacterium]